VFAKSGEGGKEEQDPLRKNVSGVSVNTQQWLSKALVRP
jgi:hypothetical protein